MKSYESSKRRNFYISETWLLFIHANMGNGINGTCFDNCKMLFSFSSFAWPFVKSSANRPQVLTIATERISTAAVI